MGRRGVTAVWSGEGVRLARSRGELGYTALVSTRHKKADGVLPGRSDAAQLCRHSVGTIRFFEGM